MRTSPQRLIGILETAQYDEKLILRSADLREIVGKLDWREAYSAAHRGEIEGVGTSGNPIKYFRILPDSERATAPPTAQEQDDGDSTAFAHTNLGVFREAIRASVVTESFGHRAAIASGEITGHVWTHCAMRVKPGRTIVQT